MPPATELGDRRTVSAAARIVAAAAIGILIGAVTSLAQAHLNGPWAALANSASPWLLGSFAAGAIQLRRGWGIGAGLAACVLEVIAYYVVTSARGFAVSNSEIVFWTACALVGGPIFGWAGWTWWRGPTRQRPLGAALLPATFLAEGIGTYQLRLHYGSDAVLYVVTGVVLLVVVAWPLRRASAARVVVATLTATVLGIVVYWLLLDALAGAHFGG